MSDRKQIIAEIVEAEKKYGHAILFYLLKSEEWLEAQIYAETQNIAYIDDEIRTASDEELNDLEGQAIHSERTKAQMEAALKIIRGE